MLEESNKDDRRCYKSVADAKCVIAKSQTEIMDIFTYTYAHRELLGF